MKKANISCDVFPVKKFIFVGNIFLAHPSQEDIN